MGRLLKIILYFFISVILLILLAVVVLPLVIDPNDYKPEIQAAVKDNLGRELTIEGDLELSVFPWIGISTGKLILSNAKGFDNKPFAEIVESNIKVKLLPLFSKKLEVSRIVLKGLVLNLAKNKQGISNWDDLSKADKTKSDADVSDDTATQNASPLAALAIGGIAIEQANIVWDDQQQGKYTEINDFNFKMDALVFNEPIAVDLSLKITNKDPELTESIIFSTDLVINEALNVFNFHQVDLESITKGKDIPGETLTVNLLTEIAVDLAKQTLNVSGLKLHTGNLNLFADITGTNILDKPVFKGPIKVAEFNPSQLMKQLAMSLPEMQDSSALNKLAITFNLLATANSAAIENLNVTLDDTNIIGTSSINNFAKPAIKFDITIDAIDVDRYLAPVNDKDSPKPATPASAAAATAALFPVKTLRDLNVNGKLSIGKLKINKLNMQGLNLFLNAKNGLIKTQQTVKQLYQGSYNGYTTINVKNKTPAVSLNEKLTMVKIEPLLIDMLGFSKMTGLVNATAIIQARGNTVQTIKSTLNGNVAFSFKDGLIRGFNLQKIIDNAKALLKGSVLPTDNKNDQTVFSVIKGKAKITNGLIRNDDLYAEASKLRVNGKGTVNLVSDKLDYKINAKLLKSVATATEAEKLKGSPIIINIGGTMAKPSYQLDIASMLLQKNKDKINKKKDELLKKLDEKIAPGVSDLLKGFF